MPRAVAWGPSVDLGLLTLILILRVCPLQHPTNESGDVVGEGYPWISWLMNCALS